MKVRGQPASRLGDMARALIAEIRSLFVAIPNDGRASFQDPGAGHVGDEQKARLIQEHQMGPKSSAFFYMRPAVAFPVGDGHVVPLQGPALRFLTAPPQAAQEFSRRGRDGRPRRTAVGSSRRPALTSTDPSDTRPQGHFRSTVASRFFCDMESLARTSRSRLGPKSLAIPFRVRMIPAEAERTAGRVYGTCHGQQTLCPPVAAGWPVGGAAASCWADHKGVVPPSITKVDMDFHYLCKPQ